MIADYISHASLGRCDVHHNVAINQRVSISEARSVAKPGRLAPRLYKGALAPFSALRCDAHHIVPHKRLLSLQCRAVDENVPLKCLGRRFPDAPQPLTRVGGWAGGAAMFPELFW